MPTLLDLIRIPPPRMHGRSLLPLLSGSGEGREGPVYSEIEHEGRLRSVFERPYHYIEDRDRSEAFLFDVSEDPAEARNLAGDVPRVAERLARRLARYGARLERPEGTPAGALSPAREERLRELGYIE